MEFRVHAGVCGLEVGSMCVLLCHGHIVMCIECGGGGVVARICKSGRQNIESKKKEREQGIKKVVVGVEFRIIIFFVSCEEGKIVLAK